MTTFTANTSFFSFDFNLSQIKDSKSGFLFKDNIKAVIDGVTYQDVAAYQFGLGIDRTAYFRGTGLAVSSADKLTAGTVTGMALYTGALPSPSSEDWSIKGIKVAATTIATVMGSSSLTDDAKFFVSLFTGDDLITLSPSFDLFDAGAGNDLVYGKDGDDTLYGGAGNDKLYGGVGFDQMDGGAGDDVLSGGAGIDTASYLDTATAVTVNLSITTQQNTGGAGKDTLTGIERLYGGKGDDTLTGTNGANEIIGMKGADVIRGLGGNDMLYGELGKDTLTGGAGKDKFLFHTAPALGNADTITDFSHTEGDKLVLSASIYSGTGATPGSVLAKGAFYAAAGAKAAHDADDRIIYDTASGKLYYDADGQGGSGPVIIATLQGHPALFSSDILFDY